MIREEGNHILSPKKETASALVLLSFFIFSWFFIISATGDAQEAVQSGYGLIGTIQSGDLTGAVIAVTKGEQSFFRKFEKLPDGSQIVGVHPDSIMLKRPDGTTFEMYVLHDTKTVASVQPVQPVQSVQPVQTIQPTTRVDPYAQGSIRSAPGERPLSSYEKRHGRRKSDSGNE